jgi:hypothetical protein
MVDGLTIDTTEFDRAIAQLSELPRQTLPFVRSALAYNATLVKQDWRDALQGTPSAPRVPLSITYTTKNLDGGFEVEVGAEKGTGKQGGVALLLEYGAPGNPSHLAAHGYGLAALQKNVGDLEQGIGKAIEDGLRAIDW